MLSDEERKAIESFKEENNNDLSRFDDFNSYTQFKVKRDKIIIDLIDKQSKEIEELKKYQITFTNDYKPIGSNGRRFISEDKIKAKIEEVEQCELYDMKNPRLRTLDERLGAKIGIKCVLQSLLEKE